MGKKTLQSVMSTKVDQFATINVCKHLKSCQFGYAFVAKSTPKFRAPKQTAMLWRDQFGTDMPTIVKVTKCVNARSGNYTNKVNKAGATDFVADGLNGYEWVIPNVIKRATKDGSLQLCVTFTNSDKTNFDSKYVVADHFATDAELAFIKERLYSAPSSAKQIAAGVAPTDEVFVRNYKFDNILKVGTNSEVEEFWNEL